MAKATLTAAEQFAAMAPKAIDLSALPETIEVEVAPVPDYSGAYAGSFIGWLDEARTIHARVYVGTEPSELRKVFGRVLKTSEANPHESQHQDRKGVMKFVWGDPVTDKTTSNLITLYVPDTARITGVKLVEAGS